jgi:hypothetical protein
MVRIPGMDDFSASAYAVKLDSPFWAGKFTENIARGRTRAYVLFDQELVKSKIHNTIKATGIKYITGADDFTIQFGDFFQKMSIEDVMQFAAFSSIGIAEATTDILKKINTLLEKVAELYSDIALLIGELELSTSSQRAYISDIVTGKKVGFDIYDWASRNLYEEELHELVEGLVSKVMSNHPPITCACGRPSWIGKHLRSRQWLQDDNLTVVHRNLGNAIEFYTVECEEHFTPLHQKDLENVDINIDELENLWLHNLERSTYELRAIIAGIGKERMVYVFGHNASDLALHPGLLASLLQGLEIEMEQKKPHVDFYLPTTNTMVLYWDTTFELLRSSFDRSRELELEFPGEHGENLNYFDGMSLLSEPRGILKITIKKEKVQENG